jgi:hypothetical protein
MPWAIIAQQYDPDTDACQVHEIRQCTVDKKAVGESAQVWYTDDDGKRRSELVDPMMGIFGTRKAAEIAAAGYTASSIYGADFRGARNRAALARAQKIDDAYPVGPERSAIFEAARW